MNRTRVIDQNIDQLKEMTEALLQFKKMACSRKYMAKKLENAEPNVRTWVELGVLYYKRYSALLEAADDFDDKFNEALFESSTLFDDNEEDDEEA